MENPDALFLQLVLAAKYVSESSLLSQINHLNTKLSPEERRSIDDVVIYANYVLEAVEMELKLIRDDFANDENYYCVVEHVGDDSDLINKLLLSKPQCAQLKDMLDVMFTDSNLAGMDVAGLSVSAFSGKDFIVSEMIQRGFFIKLPPEYEGQLRVIISMQLLAQMESYLDERYGNKTLFRCLGCEKWLLHGKLCSTPDCGARLHERCYDAYFRLHEKPPGTCPKCGGTL